MMNTREISIEAHRVRVVNILTSSLTVRFLEGQPEYFEKKGFEVIVVSSPGEELNKAQRKGVQTVAVPMAREISPWSDLLSLWRTLASSLASPPGHHQCSYSQGGPTGRDRRLGVSHPLPILYRARIAMRNHNRAQAAATAFDRAHRMPVRSPSDLRQRELAAESNRLRYRGRAAEP